MTPAAKPSNNASIHPAQQGSGTPSSLSSVAKPTNGPQTSLQHQITPASVTHDRIPPQPNQPPQRKVTFSNAPNQSSRPAEPIASSSKAEPEIDNFVEESFGYSEDDDFFASVDLGDLDRPIEDDGDIGRPINLDEDLGNPQTTTKDLHRFHVGAPPGMHFDKDLGNPQTTTKESHRFHVGSPPGNKDLGNPPTTKESHRLHVGAPPPKPGPATGMLSALLPQQSRRAPQGQNIPPAKPMTFTKRTATPSIGGFHFPSGMVCLVRARL